MAGRTPAKTLKPGHECVKNLTRKVASLREAAARSAARLRGAVSAGARYSRSKRRQVPYCSHSPSSAQLPAILYSTLVTPSTLKTVALT